MLTQLSEVPIKGSLLREILFEPGIRLSLKLLCPFASAGVPWTPAEYQLQFHRITQGSFEIDIADIPQEVLGYEVVLTPTSRTSAGQQKDQEHRSSKIRLQLEHGQIEVVAEGFTIAPLQPIVVANRR